MDKYKLQKTKVANNVLSLRNLQCWYLDNHQMNTHAQEHMENQEDCTTSAKTKTMEIQNCARRHHQSSNDVPSRQASEEGINVVLTGILLGPVLKLDVQLCVYAVHFSTDFPVITRYTAVTIDITVKSNATALNTLQRCTHKWRIRNLTFFTAFLLSWSRKSNGKGSKDKNLEP